MAKRSIAAVEPPEQKAHAVFGASKAERWLNCPGSIALSEKAPEPVESKYALEGTTAHKCLEDLLKAYLGHGDLMDAVCTVAATFPMEMVRHASDAADWIIERQGSASVLAELFSETKVDASSFTCEGQFGTVDAAIVDLYGRLVVVDFKYGAGIAVDPAGEDGRGNAQMAYYALGISEKFGHDFTGVDLVIIQPRAYHEQGPVRIHSLTMSELEAWGERFQAGVIAAKQPDAPLCPGSWCKFCPAGVICPEIKTKAMTEARIVFTDDAGLMSVPEPKLINGLDLGQALDACDRLEEWIKHVRNHAMHVLERGGSIPGYKLIAKRAHRTWGDEAHTAIEARLRFGDEAFAPRKLLTPAQLKASRPYDLSIDDWIEDRVVRESSGSRLVPDRDPRAAVKTRAQIFGVIPDEAPPVVSVVPARVSRKKRRNNVVWTP